MSRGQKAKWGYFWNNLSLGLVPLAMLLSG